ncbi:hypothetical protein WG66_006325, partial [Moniliophthora roreri]
IKSLYTNILILSFSNTPISPLRSLNKSRQISLRISPSFSRIFKCHTIIHSRHRLSPNSPSDDDDNLSLFSSGQAGVRRQAAVMWIPALGMVFQ